MQTEHKSERLKRFALKHGWKAEVVPDLNVWHQTNDPKDILWVVYAVRDKENVKVIWQGDLFKEAVYKYGAYSLHPARTGSVLNLLASTPDPTKFSGGHGRLAQTGSIQRMIDWDDDTPAFDILVKVINKEIRWVTSFGEIKSERCPKDSNIGKLWFRVTTTKNNDRVLEWSNSFGFHACYIKNILSVT